MFALNGGSGGLAPARNAARGWRAVALAAAAAALLAACGTGEDPTQLEEYTGAPPSIEGLRTRATEATDALNREEWLEFYEFKSPRSVRPRLPYGLPAVQLCTKEQFIFDMGDKTARIRALGGYFRLESLTWEIVDVQLVEATREDRVGDGGVGVVRFDIHHEGELITDEFHDYLGEVEAGARWVFLNGAWWVEPADWGGGCHKDRFFGV